MIRNSFLLAIMFFYVNILGYVFHIVVSRAFGPEKYGEFMVIYSFMLSIGFISVIYPNLTIKMVIENGKIRYDIFRFIRLISIILGVILLVLTLLNIELLADFLNVKKEHLFIVPFIWLLIFMTSAEKGFLQAVEKFGLYSAINSFELTNRFLVALIFIYLGYEILGVLFATFLALLSTLIILISINKNLVGNISFISFKKVISTALASVPTGLFIYADDIFIKRIFDPKTAGLYASASVVGKAFTWFCITIFSAFFVRIIKDFNNYRKTILSYFAFILIIFLITELLILTIGEKIFIFLFGPNFQDAFSYLKVYIPLNIPLILTVTLITANIGLEKITKYVYLHLLTYYFGFLILNFPTPYEYLLYIFLINSGYLFIYLFKIFRN
ncbi:MAG: oligosaccharide flippase family protein [Hydrogenothermaceae bacterium]|nr:oligosaccharide flippase family protein [Hydrogenothermaceae bacterium]